MKNKLAMVVGMASSMLVMSSSAQAVTSISSVISQYTTAAPSQTVNLVKPNSWYNLTMGYKGWTHHSKWGYFTVTAAQVGKVFSITADATATAGVHPGISVWYTPQGKGIMPVAYAFDHFYNQAEEFTKKNVRLEATATAAAQDLGAFKQYFVANGFDRDGMATIDAVFDQSHINKIQDGVIGVVTVNFVAEKAGTYKFVVGGINPDVDPTSTVAAPNNVVACPAANATTGAAAGCPVKIDVTFPE